MVLVCAGKYKVIRRYWQISEFVVGIESILEMRYVIKLLIRNKMLFSGVSITH